MQQNKANKANYYIRALKCQIDTLKMLDGGWAYISAYTGGEKSVSVIQ